MHNFPSNQKFAKKNDPIRFHFLTIRTKMEKHEVENYNFFRDTSNFPRLRDLQLQENWFHWLVELNKIGFEPWRAMWRMHLKILNANVETVFNNDTLNLWD